MTSLISRLRNYLLRRLQVRQMRDLMPLRQHAAPRTPRGNEPADSHASQAGGLDSDLDPGTRLLLIAVLGAMDVLLLVHAAIELGVL